MRAAIAIGTGSAIQDYTGMITPPPKFITFTGVDDVALLKGMRELSTTYPIEWGVLVDFERMHENLFPTAQQIDRMRRSGLRLSAHVCGKLAQAIVTGNAHNINLSGFSRVQVNHGREGANETVVRHVADFSAENGLRGVLQCTGVFPKEENRVDWLYDVSFGEGIKPSSFPSLEPGYPFCGFSGGLNAENVADRIASAFPVSGNAPYWIDMESGVRSNGSMDLNRCKAVCEAVYPDR